MKGQKTYKIGLILIKFPLLYYLLLYTWGIIYSAIGILWSVVMIMTGHKPHYIKGGWYFVSWFNGGWGFELGNCFVISKDAQDDFELICHEKGHLYQNAIFGLAFIFIVFAGIIRYWYREIHYYKKGIEPITEYEDIWFEKSATMLGKESLMEKGEIEE